ncbi:hypothetical protein, partial [Nocardia carnea]|uniref:hypothetical protein n=1 Tax=Nocardia carnea TaxID=37328 RepID=UPI0024549BAC
MAPPSAARGVCGAAGARNRTPPAPAATLGILENFDIPALPPEWVDNNGGVPRAEAVHLIAEAERDHYVAVRGPAGRAMTCRQLLQNNEGKHDEKHRERDVDASPSR